MADTFDAEGTAGPDVKADYNDVNTTTLALVGGLVAVFVLVAMLGLQVLFTKTDSYVNDAKLYGDEGQTKDIQAVIDDQEAHLASYGITTVEMGADVANADANADGGGDGNDQPETTKGMTTDDDPNDTKEDEQVAKVEKTLHIPIDEAMKLVVKKYQTESNSSGR